MNFIIETDKIDQYKLEVEQILDVLGHSEALVTDHSRFFDFTLDPAYGMDDEEVDAIFCANSYLMAQVSELCGYNIDESEYILDAAQILRQKMNAA